MERWDGAGNWGFVARSLGIPVDYYPAVGAVAWNYSSETHVAWVKAVDGDSVTVDEYNWDGDGLYHTRTKQAYEYDGFIHIKDIDTSVNHFDINFFVDGEDRYNLDGIGTLEVYIDGQKWPYNESYIYTDFYRTDVPVGKPYQVKFNITDPDYYCAGVDMHSDSFSGLSGTTRSGGTNIRAVFCKKNGCERTIPDGNYAIVSALNNSYFIDIAGSDFPGTNGTNIQLWGPSNEVGGLSSLDIWSVKYIDGYYKISQMNSNGTLDVTGGSTNIQSNVQLYQSNDADAQRWAITPSPGQCGYSLQSKSNGYYLTVAGGNASAGANVYVNYASFTPNAQAWLFIPYRPEQPLEDGKYIIVSSMDDTLELDVSGNSEEVAEETNVQVWHDDSEEYYENSLSRYNAFNVERLDNGYYKLIQSVSGKSADLFAGGTRIGSNISMHTDNGAAAQQWAIIPEGVDGGYTIRVRCSGYAMNVADGGTANGTNVNQYPYNGGPNQVWRFIKAEHTISYDANGGNGAPSSQTKYYKGKLLLSETVPAREGYLFAGWAGSPEAGTAEYRPGDVYSTDEDVILYARWISNDDVQEFPSHLETVGNGAFSNTDMKAIRLHAEVISIGENAFDEDTIIVAPEGSYAAHWAEDHGMQVILEN